ncbi:MAG: hypothetical protein C4532_00265 [Candidatus Abyssobacteria bacterium SURF_17]|uniref:Uroporphyrinogen decarboxylase (URO-D) domain-containing protein n=1 Tax=Candidatus Abyssobacteria bacterium SURF_17 TaxID=2093361 RepID=A0A419F9Q8_9BACT|nr:MAG: hypothetical protein C4532_00265 [Candidatus Abyssubacteria bacterium SURF_17]
MTSKERVRTAVAHRESDRIPVFELSINSPVASDIMGRQMYVGYGGWLVGKMFSEYMMEERTLELVMRIFQDSIELYSHLELDLYPLPTLPLTTERVEPVGENQWKYTDPDSGFWRIITYNPESDFHSEIDSKLKQEGIEALREYVNWLEQCPSIAPPDMVAGLKAVLEPARERFFVLGQADILLPTGSSWLPLFLECMALEPELVERYFEATTTEMLSLIDAQAEAGVDGFIGGTDLAHTRSTLISPAMFRRFIFPHLRRITERCHSHSLAFFKHTDGNIESIEREFLLECGLDGYHAIEPSAGMDIRRLKQQYGDKITLLGNVDCGQVLTNGSQKDIIDAVRRCIRDAAPGGGYVLSSSNSIHSGIPTENFLTLLKAAREYGAYPIGAADSARRGRM